MSLKILGEFDAPWVGRPGRLGTAVLANLVDLVVSGRLAPGDAFPSEAELGAHYGVSRTVVREAMRSLEDKGLAEIRQGQGTTVTPTDSWDLLDPVVLDAAIRHDESLALLDDLVAVRVSLEAQMAHEAALHITDAQLAEARAMLDTLRGQLSDPVQHSKEDARFHDLIMRASGSALGRSIVRSIHTHARASSRYNGPMDDWDLSSTHQGHLRIYERLADHDADGAAQAMRDHILTAWQERRQARPPARPVPPPPVTTTDGRRR